MDQPRRAGDAAWGEVAFEEAANYYERALGALDLADDPDPATRAELLRAAGTALVTIADPRGCDLLYPFVSDEHADDDYRVRVGAEKLRSQAGSTRC